MNDHSPIEGFLENLEDLLRPTGVIEILPEELVDIDDFARRYDLYHVDWLAWKLQRLPIIDPIGDFRPCLGTIQEDLQVISEDGRNEKKKRVISNLDICLTGLGDAERRRFWEWAIEIFRPPRALVLILPAGDRAMWSLEERERWKQCNRLIRKHVEDATDGYTSRVNPI